MNLQNLLNVKYPIMQGGMAQVANAEFAAAVSNSGGLGQIGSGGMEPETLRKEIQKIKTLTDKPYGVNVMMLNYYVEEMVDIIVEEKVPVVTTGAGNPGKYIEKLKDAGCIVIPVVASPTLARRMEKLGADAVIAEGTEAGGHVGEMTTITLIPQTVSQVSIPVIAAGGIASGEQMFAAEVLGAAGVQVGTMLLVAEEGPIHENYKEKIISGKDNQITVIGRSSGAPSRVLRNSMTKEYLKKEKAGADLEELELFTVGALRKAVLDGDVQNGTLMAGFTVGQVNEIRPMKNIIEGLYEDYVRVKNSWEK